MAAPSSAHAAKARHSATTSTSGDILRQILVIIATLSVIASNLLADIIPINNLTTAEISDRFNVYFVPAGYVFSIWGLIYVALAGYTVYQALPSQRTVSIQRRIAYPYIFSSLFNVIWIVLWHYELFTWTLLVMLGLLASLIIVYMRLNEGRKPASRREFWLLYAPFSLYLGWITVATIANATTLLNSVGWSGGGISPELWAVIMLAVATIAGVFFGWMRHDVVYAGVLVWSFAGIAYKHWATPLVAYTAVAAVVIVAGAGLLGAKRDDS
ncbi:MAG: tryptophan-rich sensory protein [Caldilineaceae bacterium]|nr:tryptophan-rich sensory protein [Caldilineaceae bacterium]